MDSIVKLFISTNRRFYFPNELVEGKICLKTKKLIEIEELDICFSKYQNISIRSQDKSFKNTQNPQNSYKHHFKISSNMEIGSGDHIFPFKFIIKDGEGGSTNLKTYLNNLSCSFENSYKLVATCKLDNHISEAVLDLIVHNKSDERLAIDTKIKIQSFMCLFSTHYFYRIVVDKLFYSVGDTVTIECLPTTKIGKNLISRISISLYEIIVFYIDRNKSICSKMISETKCNINGKNRFNCQIKLPTKLSATVNEKDFSIQVALYISIEFHQGSPIKIKKYINVGRSGLLIPDIEEASVFSSKIYSENTLTF